jgi:hypothetical protein
VKSRVEGVDMWKKGTFATHPRYVKVRVKKIHVYDDGDDLSQGDFQIRVKSAGKELLDMSMGLDTGQTVNMLPLPFHLLENPPESFDVLVEAFESDSPAVGIEFQHWEQATHTIEVPYHVADGWSTDKHYRLETSHWDIGVWIEFKVGLH